jgi:type IV pilus assembly protein PilQ
MELTMTTRDTVKDGRTLLNNGIGFSRIKGIGCALALSMIAGTSASWAQTGDPFAGNQPDIRNPLGAEDVLSNGEIKVNEHDIVDLHVQDEDLAMVLQMLSIQTQKNIITGKGVTATVTANLYGVTFYEALDAILHANGYGYIEKGNFITIYTNDELKVIQEASRVKTIKVIDLNYLNAVDAAAFVQSILSPEGQITTNGKALAFKVSDSGPTGGEDYAQSSQMLVNDWEENVIAIEEILKQLDTKPVQVLVEAVVLHTTLTEENAWGVDVSVLGALDYNDFIPLGGTLKAIEGLVSGNGSGSVLRGDGPQSAVVQNTGGRGPGTLKFGLVSGDVSVFVRMLDQVSDTKIVSKPNILTLNRQASRVLVGRKVGYLSTTATQTSTTQTVEFLDTGTQLYFRPFVSSDGMIRMELKPQISEAVIRDATDATGAAVTIPDEITNEITTNVMVRDGQTIVLGGLFRESTTASRSQIPFLGDLPMVGAAFRGNDDLTERTEIIFMVTPSILNDKQLIAQADRASSTVRRVRAGFRAGLLPWSREKMTSKLLVEAQRLAREGKTQAALNKIQRSLRLSPYQPDAIELREALMGKESVWPKRNMLFDIIHGETEAFLESLPEAKVEEKASIDDTVSPVIEPAEMVTLESEESFVTPFIEVEPQANVFSDEQFGTLTEMTESAPTPTTHVFSDEPEIVEATPEIESASIESPEVEVFDSPIVEMDTPDEMDNQIVPEIDQPTEVAEIDDGLRDFTFLEEDIQSVLRTIAAEFQENVIFGQDVTGKVTAQLYDVSFEEALGAILLANGYETVDRGSYLEVRAPEVTNPVPTISQASPTESAEVQNESVETAEATPWNLPAQYEAPVAEAPAESTEASISDEQANVSQPVNSPFSTVESNVGEAVVSQPVVAENVSSTPELDKMFESAASDRFWGDVFLNGWNFSLSHIRYEDAGPVSVDPATEDLWFDSDNDPYREYWQAPIVEVDEDGSIN